MAGGVKLEAVGSANPEERNEPTISPDELEINRLAFERGLASLQAQSALLDNLRQRAGTVAALSSLAATFLGREALNDSSLDRGWSIGSLGILEISALLLVGVSVLCLIQVLRPRTGWLFDFEPMAIINQFARGPKSTTLCNTYYVLADFAQKSYEENEDLLRKMHWWLWASIVALLAQMYCWAMDFL